MQRLRMLWEDKGDGPQTAVWAALPKQHQLEAESRLDGASSDVVELFLHF